MTASTTGLLDALPAPGTPQFAFEVPSMMPRFAQMRAELEALMRDPAQDAERRFRACYVLAALTWRDRDFAKYESIVAYGAGEFPTVPLMRSLEAQSIMGPCEDAEELETALGLIREAIAGAPRDPGSRHTHAEIVASLAELGRADRTLILEGEAAVRDAKRLRAGAPYAKYHATHARLLTQLGRWDEARRQVAEAIDTEPSDGPHYALRVGDYQDIRAQIAFAEKSSQLTAQHDALLGQQAQALRSFEGLRGEVVQLLGLLAAIIAFLVSGTQIAKGFGFRDAAALIGLMGASILIVFGAFNLLWQRTGSPWRQSAVIGLGAVLAAASLAARSFL